MEGLGRCVGQAVKDYATATSSVTLSKVVLIGIAPWGLVNNREQLVNPEVTQLKKINSPDQNHWHPNKE